MRKIGLGGVALLFVATLVLAEQTGKTSTQQNIDDPKPAKQSKANDDCADEIEQQWKMAAEETLAELQKSGHFTKEDEAALSQLEKGKTWRQKFQRRLKALSQLAAK